MEDSNISDAISYGLEKLQYANIKPDQKIIVEAYVKGRDAFFSSPTGSGKSLVFEIAPFVFEKISQHKENLVLVISPLSSLMKSQVCNLKEKAVNAVYLKDSLALTPTGEIVPTLRNLTETKTDIIFGSPETFMGKHRKLLQELSMKRIVRVIFVDEAHCIKKYGYSSDNYGQLGEIRSLFGARIPVVALTATASPEMKTLITKDLCMVNYVDISRSPDKPNITYWVQELQSGDIFDHFQWLVHLLREKNTSTNDDRNRLFDMFHLKTDDEVKDSICVNYQNPNGNTRVVLSSTSFSMGLDVKGVDYVIHYGPANDIDDYVQETGRAGRDLSQQCHAVLMKYKRCLNSKTISKEMKEYVKTNDCKRNTVLQYFGFTSTETIIKHNCCDACAKTCKCKCTCPGKCSCISSETCEQTVPSVISEINVTTTTLSDEAESTSSTDYSDSDIKLLPRRPQVLFSSSDSE